MTEQDNIINHPTGTIIMNGGNALPGCPTDWDWAYKWMEAANDEADSAIKWGWDCGFKLDYDGPIVRISSRFYPPKTHYGPKWDGNVTLMIGDKDIVKKHFEVDTLEELRAVVESYVKELSARLISAIESIDFENPKP